MAKKMMCWKRSQTSSGFYKKIVGKPAVFIRFHRHKDGRYDVDLDTPSIGKTLNVAQSKAQALRFAKEYMRKHDKC